MDAMKPRYTVIPKQCLEAWVESTGIPKLNDEICGNLAEDVTYRLREAVHNAVMFMKHAKRTWMTTEDFNNALKEANTEPVYGHSGAQLVTYKSVPFKGTCVCYVDEKDVNLREAALESIYPLDAGEMSVKASWMVLEGKVCSSGKIKEEDGGELEEPVRSYVTNMMATLLGRNKRLLKVALCDLQSNKKLQLALPCFVSLISTQVKLRTNKVNFARVTFNLVLAVNVISRNCSVILAPYTSQLIKMLLFVLIDAKLSFEEWYVRDVTALALANICLVYSPQKDNFRSQVIHSLNEAVKDVSRSINSLYGVIVALKHLGTEAILETLVSNIDVIVRRFDKNSIDAPEEISVHVSFCDTMAELFRGQNCFKSMNYKHVYEQVLNICGDCFTQRCVRMGNRVDRNTKNNSSTNCLQYARQSGAISSMIEDALKKLANPVKTTECSSKNDVVKIPFVVKNNRRRLSAKRPSCFLVDDFAIPNARKSRRLDPTCKGQHFALRHYKSHKSHCLLTEVYFPVM